MMSIMPNFGGKDNHIQYKRNAFVGHLIIVRSEMYHYSMMYESVDHAYERDRCSLTQLRDPKHDGEKDDLKARRHPLRF